jgi:hypothetical protein
MVASTGERDDVRAEVRRLIELCEDAKLRKLDVVIHDPTVLGDTYEEIIESLSRVADAGLQLAIPPRSGRSAPSN